MNDLVTEAVIAFSGGDRVMESTVIGRSYAPHPGIDASTYARKIDDLLGLYPWQIQLPQLNLLDSHDTSRFLTIVGEDRASVRLGTLLLFTFPGAPSIYYGDEIGLTGALPDLWVRTSFPWDHPDRWDHDLRAYHKAVIPLRAAHSALRVGDYRVVVAKGSVYAFTRSLNGASLLVAINAGATAQQITVQLAGKRTVAPIERFATAKGVKVTSGSESVDLALPPRAGAVIDLSRGNSQQP